jgi:hypothetical protein
MNNLLKMNGKPRSRSGGVQLPSYKVRVRIAIASGPLRGAIPFLFEMEQPMRFLKAVAVVGTLVGGALGLSAAASASPLASTAMPAAQAGNGVVTKAQMYIERRVYRPRRVVRTYPAYRPVYRPYRRMVRPYPIYRPVRGGWAPRIACRTRIRLVRTRYGFVQRPVRVCIRRY